MGSAAGTLRKAAGNGDVVALADLLNKNPAVVNEVCKRDRTSALIRSVPNVACMKMLLAAGADVNLKDRDGCTALNLTMKRKGSLEAIKLLLSARSDANTRDHVSTFFTFSFFFFTLKKN